MPNKRQSMLISAVLLGSATGALAFDTTPCFQPTIQIEDITTALSADGWQTADRSDASVADHLTWMGMPQYFAGDSGGQSLTSVLEMKRMSATGILRKKDLETAKTRVLTRDTANGTEIAKVAVVSLTAQHASVHCTFSLQASSVDGWSDAALGTDTTQQFTRLTSAAPAVPNAQASQDIVALNRAGLSETLGAPLPSDAIFETYLSFMVSDQ